MPYMGLADHLASIKDNLREVVMPPAAMGSGHRGAAHKCGLIAFGWRLGCDASKLQKFAQSFVSHTSDMGVELGIPDFTCSSHSAFLPAWMADQP